MIGYGILVGVLLATPRQLAAQVPTEPPPARDTALVRAAATWGCDYDTVVTTRAAARLAGNRGTAHVAAGSIQTACQALAQLGVPDATRFTDSVRAEVVWGYRPPRATGLRLRFIGQTWRVTRV